MSARSSPQLTPVSPQRVRRRGGPVTIDTGGNTPEGGMRADRPDHVVQTPPHQHGATPRSTLGSPLTKNAIRRSGVGEGGASSSRSSTRQRVTLSDVEILPWLCCMAPAFDIFGLLGAVTISAFFFPTTFYWLTAYLTFCSILWFMCACIGTFCATWKIRQATSKNWHEMLEEVQQVDPDGSSVLHIVILPNYMENERMLKETLENLGRSPLATTRMRVVLGMEAREGTAAHEKANRLIQQTSHLFGDIFASFHPEGLPGELAGKSSNTNWAYREALRHYEPILLGYDLSRVFVTVGDADTLWHPQYFSALTYSGLMMSEQERLWRIWQPPVMLMRNILSVPAMTRSTGHATLICELFGLVAPESIWPAFAFSSYSLTLALAAHPEVDGWDPDVIAEDHHMFCKCFFACLWSRAQAAKDAAKHKSDDEDAAPPITIDPAVQVEPIFLPAVSYLVETHDGWRASIWAKFQQARRHMQGVVELGYILLQYMRFIREVGLNNIPAATHRAIIRMVLKIHIHQIQTNAQIWSLFLAILLNFVPQALSWIINGGIAELFWQRAAEVAEVNSMFGVINGTQRFLLGCLRQMTGLTLMFAICSHVVIIDVLTGRYYECLPHVAPSRMLPMAEGDDDDNTHASGSEASSPLTANQKSSSSPPKTRNAAQVLETADEGSDQRMPSFVLGPLPFTRHVGLFLQTMSDTVLHGYSTIVLFSLIPTVLAAWSLFIRGTDFDYIVADKPE